jgi:pimeloyl-ACP methyl ester carboxylesterase
VTLILTHLTHVSIGHGTDSHWHEYSHVESLRAIAEAHVLPYAAMNALRHFPFSRCEGLFEQIGTHRHKLPTLVVWGEQDTTVPFKGAAVIQSTNALTHTIMASCTLHKSSFSPV